MLPSNLWLTVFLEEDHHGACGIQFSMIGNWEGEGLLVAWIGVDECVFLPFMFQCL